MKNYLIFGGFLLGTAHINKPKYFTFLNNNFWTLNIDCQSLFVSCGFSLKRIKVNNVNDMAYVI